MNNKNITKKVMDEYAGIDENLNGGVWEKIENGLSTADFAPAQKPKTQKVDKKEGKNMYKNIIKFALPAMLVFGAICFQIFGGNIVQLTNPDNVIEENKSNNWFSLVAYASADTTFEITKDMKVLLPAGTWNIRHQDGGFGVGWSAGYTETGEIIPGGFNIKGENIKSVHVESKNGSFADNIFTRELLMNGSDEEVAAWSMNRYAYNVNPVYLEGDDILNLEYFAWQPVKLIESRLTGNYKEYFTDMVTITVTFDDGEVITQIAEISIDENTGETFGQIIG